METAERVRIWNTFFKLARISAVTLKQFKYPQWQDPGYNWDRPEAGHTLGEEDMLKLSLLSWCILAAQARASHLIQECKEEKRINGRRTKELMERNFKEQWLSLPGIYKKENIDIDKFPYKVIKELHDIRNNLFHVNHDKLKKQLDEIESDKVLYYFAKFIDAMEGLNVLLERGDRKESKPEVLSIADPFRNK